MLGKQRNNNRGGKRGKRRANGDWTNRMVDPTPEELAAACAAIPGRVGRNKGERTPEQHMHAPFYAWLYDPNNVAPLAVAVPEDC